MSMQSHRRGQPASAAQETGVDGAREEGLCVVCIDSQRGLSVPVRPHVRVRAVRHGAKRLPHLPQALAALSGCLQHDAPCLTGLLTLLGLVLPCVYCLLL